MLEATDYHPFHDFRLSCAMLSHYSRLRVSTICIALTAAGDLHQQVSRLVSQSQCGRVQIVSHVYDCYSHHKTTGSNAMVFDTQAQAINHCATRAPQLTTICKRFIRSVKHNEMSRR